jgi:hypothetical protein
MLEIRLNFTFQPYFLPVTLFILLLTLILFSLILILSLDKDKLWQNPGVVVIPVLAWLNAVPSYLVIGTLSGLVNRDSKKMIEFFGSSLRKGSKLGKRVAALSELRVKFGDNFINIQTPLVMLNFCLVQIANSLILARRVGFHSVH